MVGTLHRCKPSFIVDELLSVTFFGGTSVRTTLPKVTVVAVSNTLEVTQTELQKPAGRA
jgi:hypothetical protein